MQIVCHRWRKTRLGEYRGNIGQRSQCGQEIAHPYYMGNYYLHTKEIIIYIQRSQCGQEIAHPYYMENY
jgi:hypothetical protein